MKKRGKKASSKANGKAAAAAERSGPTARVSETLFRKYSEQEIREEAGRIADAIAEREELQVEMKEVGELFKIRRESLEGRIGGAARAIRGGGVEVAVECEVRFHVPRVGMKQVWRLDTGELVREAQMSTEECQEKLFASRELAELEKMAGPAEPAAADGRASSEGAKAEAAEGAASGSAASAPEEGQDGQKLSAETERQYEQAVKILVEAQAVSATLLQRGLKIAYGRAAQLIEWMEQRGVVSKLEAGKRQVILTEPDEPAGEGSQGSAA